MRFISIFLLLACLSRGASYFVDYVGGADTNAGTTSGTAFKHCPGDPAATNTASSTTLAADDFVFFKGGVTYVLTGATGILITSSGTSGHPITYDGNSVGTFGTGKAILTNNYAVSNQAALDGGASTRSYITTKYFTVQNMGGSAVLPTDTGSAVAARPGYGVTYGGGSIGCIIDQIDFNGLGYVFNQQPMNKDSISATAVYLVKASNITISNCDFTRVCIGISAQYTDGTISVGGTISNCSFHDWIQWAIDFNTTTGTAAFPSFSINGHCTFYNTYQYDSPNWTGYGDWPHTDMIFMRGDNGYASWTKTKIYNNFFYNSVGDSGGSAPWSITEGPNAQFFNNVMVYPQKGRILYLHNTGTTAHAQTIEIYNNSILTDGVQCISIENGASFSNTTFTIENNVLHDIATGSSNNFLFYLDTASTILGTVNYNCYRTSNTTPTIGTYGGTDGRAFIKWDNGFGVGGLTLMRASPYFWEVNGINADEKFTTIDTQTNALLCNLHLQVSSPARAAGVNLTSLGITELNSDYSGAARPPSSAWDMGAYQDSTFTAFTSSLTGKVILSGKTQIK